MSRIFTCGGCQLPYVSEHLGVDASVCPRCNRGETSNRIAPYPDAMSLSGFANAVCRDLPHGWSLTLEMESFAGTLTLTDERGRTVDAEDFTSVDSPLERRGSDAVAYAMSFLPLRKRHAK